MTESPEHRRTPRDDRVRLIGSLVTSVIGAIGVAMHPRPHYLWWPSLLLLIVSLGVFVWVIARLVIRGR